MNQRLPFEYKLFQTPWADVKTNFRVEKLGMLGWNKVFWLATSVMWLILTNQSGLFQWSVAMLQCQCVLWLNYWWFKWQLLSNAVLNGNNYCNWTIMFWHSECSILLSKQRWIRSVVVAQLAMRPFSIPEVCCSYPVIGKIYIDHLFTVLTVLKRRK